MISNDALNEIANQLVAPGKGIMAADRPSPAFKELMQSEGIAHDENSYRNWSELLFKTPNLNEYVSGIIMTDEQVRMADGRGEPLLPQVIEQGMIPGISPFTGMVTLAGSCRRDSRQRPGRPARAPGGIRRIWAWASRKWRAALQIGPGTPSYYAIEANAYVMAQVAALSQEAGIVPIVEPEVMLWGDHTHRALL